MDNREEMRGEEISLLKWVTGTLNSHLSFLVVLQILVWMGVTYTAPPAAAVEQRVIAMQVTHKISWRLTRRRDSVCRP